MQYVAILGIDRGGIRHPALESKAFATATEALSYAAGMLGHTVGYARERGADTFEGGSDAALILGFSINRFEDETDWNWEINADLKLDWYDSLPNVQTYAEITVEAWDRVPVGVNGNMWIIERRAV